MTTTETIDGTRGRFDWTKPVLFLFAACMIVLIVMPLSWLAVYSVTDKANHLTLQNFVKLFTDPDFLDPLLTTAIIATSSALICCVVAAPMGWLVSRTDMPGWQLIRALVSRSRPGTMPPRDRPIAGRITKSASGSGIGRLRPSRRPTITCSISTR